MRNRNHYSGLPKELRLTYLQYALAEAGAGERQPRQRLLRLDYLVIRTKMRLDNLVPQTASILRKVGLAHASAPKFLESFSEIVGTNYRTTALCKWWLARLMPVPEGEDMPVEIGIEVRMGRSVTDLGVPYVCA